MWDFIKNLFLNNNINNPVEKNKNTFTGDLKKNINLLKKEFEGVQDVVFRYIVLSSSSGQNINACLVYINNLVASETINNNILNPLMLQQKTARIDFRDKRDIGKFISEEVINIQDVNKFKSPQKAGNAILQGKTILLLDKTAYVLSFDTEGLKERNVSTPNVEKTIRGPQEAFIENIEVNLGLIRRRIKSNNFKVVNFTRGRHSQTRISVLWLKNIADEEIVKEVIKRIDTIDTGQIIGCPHVGELIEDNPISLFNTIYESERPDVITSGILEGRIAILIDGCPTALIVPKLFMEDFISPEDYYYRFPITFALRILRFSAYLLSTLLPAIYVSIISFHQELIPATLGHVIHASRMRAPLPISLELIFFLFFFQIIKESGATVPTALSTSISIIGTLLLGQTAITSGFLSPDGVIIGSLTGIAIFILPSIELSHALFYLRFVALIAASIIGFLGVTVVSIIFLVHLAGLRSFGVPYLSPVAPLQLQDLKDFFIRVPYIFMNTRPEALEGKDKIRQGNKPVKRFFFKYKLNEEDPGREK